MALAQAYQFVIQKCNDPNVGYSMTYREGLVINGIQYYDCSSLMSAALTEGGFFETNPWFTTSVEDYYLTQAGFTKMPANTPWMAGDILWRAGHTEMVYQPADGGGYTMGAHIDGIPLEDQVSINTYVTPYSSWTYLYRAGEPVISLEWIKGNRYLSQAEMDNNAQIIASYLINYGWTKEAISGMLGNMQSESTINPGIYQSLNPSHPQPWGFGLVQWTPWTKWSEWAAQNGYDMDDGYGQLQRILYEVKQNIQWQQVTTDMTFEEFTHFTGSVQEATILFELNYEQHAGDVQPERQVHALHYYNTLDWTGGVTPIPPQKPKHKFPIWMYPNVLKGRFIK